MYVIHYIVEHRIDKDAICSSNTALILNANSMIKWLFYLIKTQDIYLTTRGNYRYCNGNTDESDSHVSSQFIWPDLRVSVRNYLVRVS